MPPNMADAGFSESTVVAGGKKGGKTGGKTGGKAAEKRALVLPTERPPFTLTDLKKAVPPHCFQPTLVESFAHLAWDLVLCALGVGAILAVDHGIGLLALPAAAAVALRVVAWAAYTFLQGVTMTGLWVIAHECGHGGFSTSDTVNDVVGFIVHSALYVPYFAWQRSHSNHHHYTNNLAKDEVFVPTRATNDTEVKQARTLARRSPIVVALNLAVVLLFGWPLYLIIDSTSHPRTEFANHFSPSSSIFKPADYNKIVLSNLGLLVWTGVLVWLGSIVGSGLLFCLYLPPLLVTNAFLVSITFLQHTDATLPHYDDADWTWLRGALCTVDRTMGRWLDRRLHFIHSTHVCHHIFSRVPFYRAEEATRALVKALGSYYNKTDASFAGALYTNFRDCNYLEQGKGILYFVEEHLSD